MTLAPAPGFARQPDSIAANLQLFFHPAKFSADYFSTALSPTPLFLFFMPYNTQSPPPIPALINKALELLKLLKLLKLLSLIYKLYSPGTLETPETFETSETLISYL